MDEKLFNNLVSGKPISRRSFLRGGIEGGIGLVVVASTTKAPNMGDVLKWIFAAKNEKRKNPQAKEFVDDLATIAEETGEGRLDLENRLNQLEQQINGLGFVTMPASIGYIKSQFEQYKNLAKNVKDPNYVPTTSDLELAGSLVEFFGSEEREKKAREFADRNRAGRVVDTKYYWSEGESANYHKDRKMPAYVDRFMKAKMAIVGNIGKFVSGRYYETVLGNVVVDIADGMNGRGASVEGNTLTLENPGESVELNTVSHETFHLLHLVNTDLTKNIDSINSLPLELYLSVAEAIPSIVGEFGGNPEVTFAYHEFPQAMTALQKDVRSLKAADFGGEQNLALAHSYFDSLFNSDRVSDRSIQTAFWSDYRKTSEKFAGTAFAKLVEGYWWEEMEEFCATGMGLYVDGHLGMESSRYPVMEKAVSVLNGGNIPLEQRRQLVDPDLLNSVNASIEFVTNEPNLGQEGLEMIRKRVVDVFTQMVQPSQADDLVVGDLAERVLRQKSGNPAIADLASNTVVKGLAMEVYLLDLYYLTDGDYRDRIFRAILGSDELGDRWERLKNDPNLFVPEKENYLVLKRGRLASGTLRV